MITIKSSWDDGCIDDIRLAKLLLKYEIPAIFYLPVDINGVAERHGYEPLRPKHLRWLASNFAIGSHTVTHPMLTRIPIELARQEIEDSKDMLQIIVDKEVDSFCYPRGYANDEIRQIVRENYNTARNTLVGNIYESEDPVWETPTVHICGKRRKEYEDTTWLQEAYRLFDEAQETEDSVYHMWGHSWEISRYDGWGQLEKLFKYITERAS